MSTNLLLRIESREKVSLNVIPAQAGMTRGDEFGLSQCDSGQTTVSARVSAKEDIRNGGLPSTFSNSPLSCKANQRWSCT